MLQIRGARLDVSLCGDSVCFGRPYSRIGRFDAGALRVHIRRRLYAFETQQNISFFDVIAFLHHNFGNLTDAFAQHIGVRQRLDFARGSDNGGQVLSRHASGLDGHDVLVDLADCEPHRAGQDGCPSDTDADFLPRIHNELGPWSSCLSGSSNCHSCYVGRLSNVTRLPITLPGI